MYTVQIELSIYAMTYPILVCLETLLIPLPLQQPVAGGSQGAVPRGARRGHTKAVGLTVQRQLQSVNVFTTHSVNMAALPWRRNRNETRQISDQDP